ncbi:hypothetical protein D3C86_1966940 [compost metagenome]
MRGKSSGDGGFFFNIPRSKCHSGNLCALESKHADIQRVACAAQAAYCNHTAANGESLKVAVQSPAANHVDYEIYTLSTCSLAHSFGPAVLHGKGLIHFLAR